MGEPRIPCLDADELVAMLEGGLAADRADVVVAHVDACGSCAQVIATLGQLDPTDPAPGVTPPPAAGGSGGPAGRRVGRYLLDAPLGAGGMGIVYGAYDPELRRRVAIKLVRPEHADDASRARMLREARSAARISHPNVVTVHDVGEHRGHVFVATELVDGETVASWHRGRPQAEILDAWIQAARGLAAAHAEGVVHRDVKPSNVLVGRDGRVRIGDFGLATDEAGAGAGAGAGAMSSEELVAAAASPSALGSSSVETATGVTAGTPAYMAPEHAAGVPDPRSDQYSLCVGVVETLTGARPAADAAVAIEPPALAAVLARALRSDPDARFPSVDALVDALVAAITPPPPPPASWLSRRWGLLAVGGAAVAVAAVIIGLVARIPAGTGAGTGAGSACEVEAVPADLWPASRRVAIAAELAPNVAPRVDRWLATWSAAAADVCATDRGDAAVRARRRRCLDAQLDTVRDQLVAFQSGTVREPWAVQAALDELPRPAQCAHAAAARAIEPTSEQAAQIEVLRAQMARAADSTEDTAAVIATARELVAAARALGLPAIEVELRIAAASIEVETAAAAALADLRAAVDLAAAAGEPWTRLTAALALLDQLGAPDAAEAERVAAAARAAIAELGGDPILDAEVDTRLGAVHRARNDDAAASAAYVRAGAALRAGYQADSAAEVLVLFAHASAAHGAAAEALVASGGAMLERFGLRVPELRAAAAGDPDALIADSELLLTLARAVGQDTPELEFHTEVNFASGYRLKREPARALRHYQRAATLADRLGFDDLGVVQIHRSIAELLIELRRPADAVAAARRALALVEPLDLDAELAETLTVLGAAQLDAGDPTAHRPLARALAIRDRLHLPSRRGADTRFLLARALPAADRPRARRLAADARAAAVRKLSDPALAAAERDTYTDHRDAIDHWLDDHPAPASR